MKRIVALAGLVAFAVLSSSRPATAAPIQNPGNLHYYEFISTGTSNIAWATAQANAASMTFLGMTGYLATLGSAPEGAWFESTFGGAANGNLAGWLGGRATVNIGIEGSRVWSWVVGPEQFDFWQETGLNGVGFAIGGAYTDWQNGEPNFQQTNADFLRYVVNGWDDTVPRPGYFVEYSAVPEPASLLLLGTGLLGARFARRRRR